MQSHRSNTVKKDNQANRVRRDIVLIILVFVLLAFFIWKWFDYRIAVIHRTIPPSDTFLQTEYNPSHYNLCDL